MAFSIRTREEKRAKDDFGLLDVALIQELQDHFCEANNLYLACLSKEYGVITKAYGSKEELTYIHSKVSMDLHVELLNCLVKSDMGNVVEVNCEQNLTKMCGVAIHINDEIAAIWIVIGVMEGTGEEIPDYIQCTTPDQFYKSIGFLEIISKQLLEVKMEGKLAQEAFLVSRASKSKMEAELRRNEVMTSVVKMLESESEFTKITNDILKSVGEYLHVTNGALWRETKKGDAADMICEYARTPEASLLEYSKGISKALLPFFNGKPYMISTNSTMPEEFHLFFDRMKIQAGVFLPIHINGKNTMYLCFCDKNKDRIWDVTDIKFLNDVKRIVQSILVKRIAKNSLASSYASFEAILENIGCGIYVNDAKKKKVLYTNEQFVNLFEKPVEEYGMDYYIAATLKANGKSKEFYFEKEQNWLAFHCSVIQWIDGREVELCTVFDITDLKDYEEKIEEQANHDALTGLYNRSRCEEDLKRDLINALAIGAESAFMYLDLDDFKHINDGLGHHYGDALLQNIAKQLTQIPGIEKSCYRIGGDEFAILVQHYHYPMLYTIIEEIQSLFAKPWKIQGTEYYCTMSMSVVRFPADGDTFDELLGKADAALFSAKKAGKNRVIFYDENMEMGSYKRLDLEKNMRNATLNHIEEFEVFYQPIVDVTSDGNPCVGAEALARWNSKEFGYVSPVDFIPLAEDLGLIIPIGEHILRTACKRCKHWNDIGQPHFSVNVNLSVIQLLSPDIVEVIERAVKETGITPENLHLEVTEGLAVNDMKRMKQILAEIKKLGVKVALDDFGTGYSSLNHIREMPIDILKIDRCFIIDIGKDNFSNAFVKMVTELARAIDVKTCVEGVESEEQVALLKEMNVNLIQGYFFGKPLKAEEFEEKFVIKE